MRTDCQLTKQELTDLILIQLSFGIIEFIMIVQIMNQ